MLRKIWFGFLTEPDPTRKPWRLQNLFSPVGFICLGISADFFRMFIAAPTGSGMFSLFGWIRRQEYGWVSDPLWLGFGFLHVRVLMRLGHATQLSFFAGAAWLCVWTWFDFIYVNQCAPLCYRRQRYWVVFLQVLGAQIPSVRCVCL